MSTHRFLVEVEVTGWPESDPEYNCTERDYAYGALWAASLRDARHLDGFADLEADATISGVEDDPLS